MPVPVTCSLSWAEHASTIAGMLQQLHLQPDFTDVTLACDDVLMPAHSLVLAACSPFFFSHLKNQTISPIIIFIPNSNPSLIHSLLTLLYRGEVTITRDDLDPFLATAMQLQITCLTDNPNISPDLRNNLDFSQNLDELFDFVDLDECFSTTEVLDPQPMPTMSPEKVTFKEKLRGLIKTSLRKETEDEKDYWHCLCCDKRWAVTMKNAHRHMETHLPEHKCGDCEKTFTNREALNVHVKKNHNNKIDRTAIVTGDDVACEAIEKANTVIDDKKSYSDQMNLLTCYKMAKIKDADGPAAWHCLVCGKSWVDKRKCRIHMQVHLVGLRLPCTNCKKAFESMRALEQHVRRCQKKDLARKDEVFKKIDEKIEKVEEQSDD